MGIANYQPSAPQISMDQRIRYIFVFLLVLSVLFFLYFFRQSKILLDEPIRVPDPSPVKGEIFDLFRLPPGFSLNYLGKQNLLDWKAAAQDLSLDSQPPKGFLSALRRGFQMQSSQQGNLYLLEFQSPSDSLGFYLGAEDFEIREWDPRGLFFSRNKQIFSLSGKYILVSKLVSRDFPFVKMHQQISANLREVRMGFPTLSKNQDHSFTEVLFEGISLGILPVFQFTGLGRCFLISRQRFESKLGPHIILRPYRIGPLQAMRAFSIHSDQVLYLQDVGGFYLVTDAFSRALNLRQKSILKRFFHIQKTG